jgi:hypothetical protein
MVVEREGHSGCLLKIEDVVYMGVEKFCFCSGSWILELIGGFGRIGVGVTWVSRGEMSCRLRAELKNPGECWESSSEDRGRLPFAT